MKRAAPLAALTLFALALRVLPWLANLPLHHDEALYGTWARAIADGSDPLLLAPWVDKPPLVLYLLASAIRTTGVSEMSLRLPGMLAGTFTVPATYLLARRLYGRGPGWAAAVLVALSPFAILFAPTAFTDGWLALFVTLAVAAAVGQRPGWAGVLLGLAAASKQQGVLFASLVLALVLASVRPSAGVLSGETEESAAEGRRLPAILQAVSAAVLGFLVVFGPVTWWDSLRWHNRPSYWDQSLQTYGGIVLLPAAEWPGRAVQWAEQAGRLYGFPLLSGLVLAGAAATFAGAWSRLIRPHPSTALPAVAPLRMPDPADTSSPAVAPLRMPDPGHNRNRSGAARVADERPFSWLIGGFVVAYFVVHIVVSFQPWDRYLLPVLPLICVLAGRAASRALAAVRRELGQVGAGLAVAAAAAALLWGASLGTSPRAAERLPVGSDIGAYRGVAEAARYLAGQPAGATVYYDRIGWHLGFYLYDAPVTRSWYDSPEKLAREAARVAADDAAAAQWLLLPVWQAEDLPALAAALSRAGFEAREAATVRGPDGQAEVMLYRIEPARTVARAAGAGKEPVW